MPDLPRTRDEPLWSSVLAEVFDGLARAPGGSADSSSLADAVMLLRDALQADTVALLKPGQTPHLLAVAGSRFVVPAAAAIDALIEHDTRAVEGTEDTIAVVAGRDPQIVAIAEGATRIDLTRDDLRAVLCTIARWAAAHLRKTTESTGPAVHERTERYDALSAFALRLGHDFRNTVAAILSHADFVLDRLDEDHIAHRDLEDIVLAARDAAAQIDTLMTYGGVLDGPTPGSVDIDRLITGMLPVLRALVPEHIELQHSIEPGASAGVQPVHLRQLLVNLVTNAAQAIGTHRGRIDLRVRIHDQDESVEIEVTDDGPGMSDAILRRCTDPFFTTRKGNRGLGLALIMGIARGVGGRVAIESALDAGTSVHVTIPRRKRTNPFA